MYLLSLWSKSTATILKGEGKEALIEPKRVEEGRKLNLDDYLLGEGRSVASVKFVPLPRLWRKEPWSPDRRPFLSSPSK